MKRVFISLPINGRSEEEILADREKAFEFVRSTHSDEVELIDSYMEEYPPEDSNAGLWYLGKSILFLAEADIAVFVEGWSKARGCIVEYQCAMDYGIPEIIYYTNQEDVK